MVQIAKDRFQESKQRQQKIYEKEHSKQYQNLLLCLFSQSKYYQYYQMIFCSLCWVICTFNAMIGSFVFMNPLFQCNGISFSQEGACRKIQQCTILNDFTAVFEDALYCQKQFIRSTIQSIFAVGLSLGVITSGIVGNILGRKWTLALLLLIGTIGYILMIIGVKLSASFLLVLSSIIIGLNASGLMIMTIILTCQVCSQKMKELSLPIYCSIFGLGQITLGFMYFYKPQWEIYLIFLLLIPSIILLFFAALFQIQTPLQYLIVERDLNKFQELLYKISIRIKISEDSINLCKIRAMEILKNYSQNQQTSLKQQIILFFSQSRNLKASLCLVTIKIAFYIHFYGTQGSMERIGVSYGTNMILIGSIEFFSYLGASYFSAKTKRKKGLLISISFCFSMGLLFLTSPVQNSLSTQTILLGLIRLSTVFIFSYLLQLQTESVDIKFRSLLLTFVFVFGELSRIVIPYMVTYFNDHKIQTVVMVSILLGILGLGPGFLLQETFQQEKIDFDQSAQNK